MIDLDPVPEEVVETAKRVFEDTFWCMNCGRRIYLVPTPSGKSAKWVTNPDRADTWHCGNDPEFPVRSHAPSN